MGYISDEKYNLYPRFQYKYTNEMKDEWIENGFLVIENFYTNSIALNG